MTPEQKRNLEELREKVRSEVSERRYRHILGVEQVAAEMVKCYADCFEAEGDTPEYTVRVAALLHDVTKDKGEKWYSAFIREQSIEIPEDEKDSPELCHAHTAPAYIRKEYPDFADPEILSAAWKHTTGDAYMTILDKIVCLADYIEQGRTHPSCIELRERFFSFDFSCADKDERVKHLDAVLLASLKNTVSYLKTLGKVPADRTLAAVDILKGRLI